MNHIDEAVLWDSLFLCVGLSDEHKLHLEQCYLCGDLFEALLRTFSMLVETEKTVPVSNRLRAKINASLERKHRFTHCVSAFMSIFDFTSEKANALLQCIDSKDAWEVGFSVLNQPPIELFHLCAGPRVAHAADAGFVRFPAGYQWPLHRHLGQEISLVLQGEFHTSDGKILRSGDTLIMEDQSEHGFNVSIEQDGLIAVLIMNGLEMPPGHRLPM